MLFIGSPIGSHSISLFHFYSQVNSIWTSYQWFLFIFFIKIQLISMISLTSNGIEIEMCSTKNAFHLKPHWIPFHITVSFLLTSQLNLNKLSMIPIHILYKNSIDINVFFDFQWNWNRNVFHNKCFSFEVHKLDFSPYKCLFLFPGDFNLNVLHF